MKSLLKIYSSSRIVKKLINRILIIETIGFLLILLLSFFILRPLLKEQAINNAGDINSQMSNKINSTIELLAITSQYIVSSQELKEALNAYDIMESEQTYQSVCLALNRLTTSLFHTRGVVLEKANGTRFDSITGLTEKDHLLLEEYWYQNISIQTYSQGYSILYEELTNSRQQTLVYARNCYVGANTYTLTIFYSANALLEEIQGLCRNTFSEFAITDRYHNVLFANEDIYLPDSLFEPSTLSNIVADSHGIYFKDTVQSNMWNVISYAKNSSISIFYSSYLLATIVLFVTLCVFTLLLIMPIIYQTISPVSMLSQTMWKVAEGELSIIDEFTTNDEIGDLSIVFNKMIISLQEHIRKLIDHEQTEQKMKYSLLISQIDPHFIYNTMNIINSLARNGQTDDIVVINNALITILQDRLRVNNIEIFDTVRHEVDILRQYLLIQSHRYENHAQINWNIDGQTLERQIPKNIIQPLVENALFHGLIDEETGDVEGEIDIQILPDEEGISIRVHDNGRGIESEKIRELMSNQPPSAKSRGRHIGLRNIRERLAYLYKHGDCMQIESNGGTTVTLYLKVENFNADH